MYDFRGRRTTGRRLGTWGIRRYRDEKPRGQNGGRRGCSCKAEAAARAAGRVAVAHGRPHLRHSRSLRCRRRRRLSGAQPRGADKEARGHAGDHEAAAAGDVRQANRGAAAAGS
eukprot:2845314-Prymnesium_polylepis.1